MGAKLDSIEEKYNSPNAISVASGESKDYSSEITEIDVDQFLLKKMIAHLQYSAMMVLYLFIQSYRKNNNIELDTISDLDINSSDYAIGVLNGFETTGLIDFKIHDNAIIPTRCDKLLAHTTCAGKSDFNVSSRSLRFRAETYNRREIN